MTTKILIGYASCGIAAGAGEVDIALRNKVAQGSLDNEITKVGCVGMCHNEPIVEIHDSKGVYVYGDVGVSDVDEIVESHLIKGVPVEKKLISSPEESYDYFRSQEKIVLRNSGVIDPEDIEEYIDSGGYEALKKALTEMTPQEVIDEIKESNLRGRGGAGFPTGLKWQFAADAPGDEKYIICNADDGDPGAFMDRSILEGDPHAVLEGMIIGAYAIGAGDSYIYCRAEYPLALKRLEIGIEQAKEKGLLGENILGTDFSFDIHIKEGAGAFVCGRRQTLGLRMRCCSPLCHSERIERQ